MKVRGILLGGGRPEKPFTNLKVVVWAFLSTRDLKQYSIKKTVEELPEQTLIQDCIEAMATNGHGFEGRGVNGELYRRVFTWERQRREDQSSFAKFWRNDCADLVLGHGRFTGNAYTWYKTSPERVQTALARMDFLHGTIGFRKLLNQGRRTKDSMHVFLEGHNSNFKPPYATGRTGQLLKMTALM